MLSHVILQKNSLLWKRLPILYELLARENKIEVIKCNVLGLIVSPSVQQLDNTRVKLLSLIYPALITKAIII